MKIAILALIANTSAVEWNRWSQYRYNLAQAQQRAHMRDIYSNEIANGDRSDDK